jgi:primosomal protein N' (replication factor Y)
MPAAELAHLAGVGTSVIKTMASIGLLEAVERTVRRSFPQPDDTRDGPALSAEQQSAAATLIEKVKAQAFSATLLDGVPGAGKTEVYFEAIAAAIAAGRQVLVLLPEIALTAQWLRRFEDRFGALPAAWHSGLTSLERRETWRAISEARVAVVVGARSALFLPFADLGLIVVDEEHDSSFKQEDGVTYNARDMAVVRARLVSAPIVLASATPSLESVTNVAAGRYGALHLPDRHGGQRLAALSAVDLKRTPPARGRWLSPPVVEAMKQTLAAGEQVLLFLNRRGYAPITLCRAAATASNVRNARPGWSSTASAASWSATTAATTSRRPTPASHAARRASSWPVGRAWSAWPRRRRSCFPKRGSSSSPPTRLTTATRPPTPSTA